MLVYSINVFLSAYFTLYNGLQFAFEMNVALNLEEKKSHILYIKFVHVENFISYILWERKKVETKISPPIQMHLNIVLLKVLFNVFI